MLRLVHRADRRCCDCSRYVADDELRCFDCYIEWKYKNQGPDCWPVSGYVHPWTGEPITYDPLLQRC